MGRGLRACCFMARPNATISFKEAADAAQQPEGGRRESSACWGDVLGLLPPDGPTKDGAVPQDASKVSPFPEGIAEECIPAGTYTTAAAAAAAPTAELGPDDSEPADNWAPQRGSQVAEERQPDATASAEWRGAQPCGAQGKQDSLEAAVAAALGLPACASTGGGTAAAVSPRPAARCRSAAHPSLQLQVAEALGDLQAAQDAVVGAGAAGWPPQHAAGGEGGLARSPSGSTAGLSSPWRTSTSSFAAEPEASKRFSCCGSACPVLETIRENISTHEQGSASLASSPACPADAGHVDSSTASQGQGAGREPLAQPNGQLTSGWAEAAGLSSEVAALLGCGPSGPSPAMAADQQSQDDIFAQLGQKAGNRRQLATAGPPCSGLMRFEAAIDQLLHAGGGMEEAATPAAAASAAAEPAPTGAITARSAIMAGRLASLTQGSEADWGADSEAHHPAGSLPQDAAAAAALPADEAEDWMPACGSAAPAEEPSDGFGTTGGAEPAVFISPATGPGAPAQLSRSAGPPRARAPPSWSSDCGEGADPLASMHDRAVHRRREAEQRHAQLRLQQEAEELSACTFRPQLLTGGRSPSRPGSTASLRTAPAAGSSFGDAAGSAMYARQQAQRQRQLERLAAQRVEQEREALAPCTFRPAVDPKSQRMFATGLRYGGSRAMVGGPAGSPSMDQAVHRQLLLLHNAGLNVAAAAAVLASQCLVPADAEHTEGGGTVPPGQLLQPEPVSPKQGHHVDLSGAAIPTVLQQAATSPARRQLSSASCTAAALLSPAISGRPLSASARLYAHAVDLQGRQRQAVAMWEQKQRAELLAASPKAKPFPRAQHTNPPSPPLSRRSPPVSRPGSAPPPSLVCASLRQAADELAVAAEPGAEHSAGPAAGRALQRSTTVRAASYWQRWGLEPGADFAGFLRRQENFVQALGAKLEAERQAPEAQQAAASTAGAHLSPGSRRLLERHRQRELAREMQAAGCMRADVAGCDAAGIAGHKGPASLLLSSSPRSHDEATAAGRAPSQAGSVAPSASAPFSYRPVITARAAAKPGRTPEELHAEAARRQEKLAQRRREAEQAALASCTFAPDIAPDAGSPLSTKFAGRAKGHIDLQDLGGYMREVRQKQAARDEAVAAAAKARQEAELAQCTFQPDLGHSHTQRSPAKPGSCRGALAGGAKPSDSACTSGPSPVKRETARPPDVLDQVQALLRGDGTGGAATAGAAGTTGGMGPLPAAGAVGSETAATVGVAGAGQAGAASDGFSAFLVQVSAELKKLQAE